MRPHTNPSYVCVPKKMNSTLCAGSSGIFEILIGMQSENPKHPKTNSDAYSNRLDLLPSVIQSKIKTMSWSNTNTPTIYGDTCAASMCFMNDDGSKLLVAKPELYVDLWCTTSGKRLTRSFQQINERIVCLNSSEDGNILMSATITGNLKIFQWSTVNKQYELLRTYHTNSRHPIACLNKMGSTVLCSTDNNDNKKIDVWDVQTGKSLCIINQENFISSATFSYDSLYIASGEYFKTTAEIWNAFTGEHVRTLNHENRVESMCWNKYKSKSLLVTGSEDGIRVWNSDTGECSMFLQRSITLSLTCIDICCNHVDNHAFIVSAGYSSVRVWSLETGDCLSVLRVIERDIVLPIGPVRISRDGKTIATSLEHGDVVIWRMSDW